MSTLSDLQAAPTAPGAGIDQTRVMGKAASENFPVASFLLPRHVRRHLLAIYGYCRYVDDVGDLAPGDRLAALDHVESELDAALAGAASSPIFSELQRSIAELHLERAPLADLLAANRLDQSKTRYATYAELVSYCELSANPVGRLVLSVFDSSNERNVALSDQICTALQLIEHLQDVAEDFAAGRVYLPLEDLARFGASEDDLTSASSSPALRRSVAFEVARARELLESGSDLVSRLRGTARFAVAGFVGGGLAQLDALASISYNVLGERAKAAGHAVALRSLGCYLKARTR